MSDTPLIAACRAALDPLVAVLIRGGVTVAQLSELAKQVYVEVARRDYGLQGRPTNNARVAMLTGLARREVTRVRDVLAGLEPPRATAESRFSAVLGGWHVDPDFLDADGAPAVLAEDGVEPSMRGLLKRYAGDLPHGAVLKEMVRLGLVEQGPRGLRALARSYVRDTGNPDIVRQAGAALRDHGRTIGHNLDADRDAAPRFERMATVSRLPRSELAAFHDFIEQQGQAFLESVDEWLTQRAVTDDEGREAVDMPTVRAGVGVYAIQDGA